MSQLDTRTICCGKTALCIASHGNDNFSGRKLAQNAKTQNFNALTSTDTSDDQRQLAMMAANGDIYKSANT